MHITVMIKNDGKAYALGANTDFRISKTLPKETIKTEKEIIILDCNNHPVRFISAVCVWFRNGKNNQLVYSYEDHDSNPIFLNLNNSNPIKLYGGRITSAAIDSEGSIIIITQSIYNSPTKSIEVSLLPDGDKAVCLACCDESILVLGVSGRVFESISNFKETGKTNFRAISGFENETVVYISGTYRHFFIICNSGRVFCKGYNSFGQLGIGQEYQEVKQFIEISSLSEHRIVSASAGYIHSLFVTQEGKVLSCGFNEHGELLLGYLANQIIHLPHETTITSYAKFAIAGHFVSSVFIGIEPPPDSPNLKMIKTFTEEKAVTDSSIIIAQLKLENEELKREISKLRNPYHSFEILDSDTIHGLRTIRRINFGASGEVFEVAKEEKYALKVMNTGDLTVENQRSFLFEYESLTMLNHPNIIRAFGIYLSDADTPLSILLELCEMDLLKTIKKSAFSNVDIAKAIYQIAEGMKYVHFKGFIHRDLKPSNILVGKDGLIKISDFGISKLMSAEEQNTTLGIETQKFMAPEILLEKNYDGKVDIYSFGVVLYFMLSGGEMPKINIIETGNGKKAEIPSNFTELSKSIIYKCWNFDPNERPNFNQIVEELDSNDYKVFDFNEEELNQIHEFVNEHKKRIPSFEIH